MKPFNKKFNFFLFLIFVMSLLLFTALSCDTTEPKENMQLQLTVLDASCTEAWLKLSAAAPVNPSVKVTTGDKIVFEGILTTTDTVIFDDSLSPSKDYVYKAELTANTNKVTTSTTIRTMDTTSHNFTWQTFSFGGVNGSSYLSDVAIINENNIWAVGEIHTEDTDQFDSSGVWVQPFNAVHWNGSEWELKRIYFPTVCGSTNKTAYPAKAIYYFDDKNEIWISSSGDKIAILKDNYQISKFCLPSDVSMSINKLWGTSSENLYAVGNGGNIAHYNGSRWNKITSGTELDIYDIWGDNNERTGEYEILAVAAKLLQSTERDIIKISKGGVSKIEETGINWSLHGVWFKSDRKYYAVGSGIYFRNSLSKETAWNDNLKDITIYYTHAVRGYGINDIFIAGAYNEVLHYNGITWKSLSSEIINADSGRLVSIAYNGNICVIVGSNGREGLLYLGKK